MSLEAAAQVMREAMREKIRRHSIGGNTKQSFPKYNKLALAPGPAIAIAKKWGENYLDWGSGLTPAALPPLPLSGVWE